MQLNLQALAQAARDSRVAIHEIAWPLGLNSREVVDVEHLGALPVAEVVQIAERVGLPLWKLFRESDAPAELEPPPGDVKHLGACIADHQHGVDRSLLARVLGWDLDRVERAVRRLRRDLAPLGLALLADDDRLRITRKAGVVDSDELATLDRGSSPGSIVDPEVALTIWWSVFMEERLRIEQAPAITQAYRQGLIQLDDRGEYAVADEVRFSLMLGDDAP